MSMVTGVLVRKQPPASYPDANGLDYRETFQKARDFQQSHLSKGNQDLMRAHEEALNSLGDLVWKWETSQLRIDDIRREIKSRRSDLKQASIGCGVVVLLASVLPAVVGLQAIPAPLIVAPLTGRWLHGVFKERGARLGEIKQKERELAGQKERCEKEAELISKKLPLIQGAIDKEIFEREYGFSRKPQNTSKTVTPGEKTVEVGDVEIPVSGNS